MKFSEKVSHVVDVTKAPYFADNTGKTDATEAIIRAIEDLMREKLEYIEETKKKLFALSDGATRDTYVGRETARVEDGKMYVTFSEILPAAKILYFPNGTYLVSDTLTYRFPVNTQQQPWYVCENCFGLHFMGESREGAVIRLADGTPAFAAGSAKPLLCFNRAALAEDAYGETTNDAFLNTVDDLTLDLGDNPGAVGLLYVSSNTGHIQNLTVRAKSASVGIRLDAGSEGYIRDLTVSGCDFGIKSGFTSPIVLERADFSGCKTAGILTSAATMILHEVKSGSIPTVRATELNGSGYVMPRIVTYDRDTTVAGLTDLIDLHREDPAAFPELPALNLSYAEEDCAYIEDYGAIPGGVEDCSLAIQKAMESGKPTVLFGAGPYLIERTVKVPKTVKCVDFLYGNLYSGVSLSSGELSCAFCVNEDADEPILFQHLYTHEQMFGFFHLIGHEAKRDLVIRDFQTLFTCVYYNTVPGSRVYIDNSFTSTGTYSNSCAICHRGYKPVFCSMIPYDFKGQTVVARNLNIERADTELRLVDSSLVSLGYKTEGPGVAIAAENSKIDVRCANHCIWQNVTERPLYEVKNTELSVEGAIVVMFTHDAPYNTVYEKSGEKFTVSALATRAVTDDFYLLNFNAKAD